MINLPAHFEKEPFILTPIPSSLINSISEFSKETLISRKVLENGVLNYRSKFAIVAMPISGGFADFVLRFSG
ncbi:MAG: hypothetical protein ACJA0S_001041 [Rickettsiales bacterium]